jgi:hypothetical protein
MCFVVCEQVELCFGTKPSTGSNGTCRTKLKLACIGAPVSERGLCQMSLVRDANRCQRCLQFKWVSREQAARMDGWMQVLAL